MGLVWLLYLISCLQVSWVILRCIVLRRGLRLLVLKINAVWHSQDLLADIRKEQERHEGADIYGQKILVALRNDGLSEEVGRTMQRQ